MPLTPTRALAAKEDPSVWKRCNVLYTWLIALVALVICVVIIIGATRNRKSVGFLRMYSHRWRRRRQHLQRNSTDGDGGDDETDGGRMEEYGESDSALEAMVGNVGDAPSSEHVDVPLRVGAWESVPKDQCAELRLNDGTLGIVIGPARLKVDVFEWSPDTVEGIHGRVHVRIDSGTVLIQPSAYAESRRAVGQCTVLTPHTTADVRRGRIGIYVQGGSDTSNVATKNAKTTTSSHRRTENIVVSLLSDTNCPGHAIVRGEYRVRWNLQAYRANGRQHCCNQYMHPREARALFHVNGAMERLDVLANSRRRRARATMARVPSTSGEEPTTTPTPPNGGQMMIDYDVRKRGAGVDGERETARVTGRMDVASQDIVRIRVMAAVVKDGGKESSLYVRIVEEDSSNIVGTCVSELDGSAFRVHVHPRLSNYIRLESVHVPGKSMCLNDDARGVDTEWHLVDTENAGDDAWLYASHDVADDTCVNGNCEGNCGSETKKHSVSTLRLYTPCALVDSSTGEYFSDAKPFRRHTATSPTESTTTGARNLHHACLLSLELVSIDDRRGGWRLDVARNAALRRLARRNTLRIQ